MRTLARWHSVVAGLTVSVKPNTWWHSRTCVTWASSTRTRLCVTPKAVTQLSLSTPSYWSQPARRWSAEAMITKASAHQFLKILFTHMFMCCSSCLRGKMHNGPVPELSSSLYGKCALWCWHFENHLHLPHKQSRLFIPHLLNSLKIIKWQILKNWWTFLNL